MAQLLLSQYLGGYYEALYYDGTFDCDTSVWDKKSDRRNLPSFLKVKTSA